MQESFERLCWYLRSQGLRVVVDDLLLRQVKNLMSSTYEEVMLSIFEDHIDALLL